MARSRTERARAGEAGEGAGGGGAERGARSERGARRSTRRRAALGIAAALALEAFAARAEDAAPRAEDSAARAGEAASFPADAGARAGVGAPRAGDPTLSALAGELGERARALVGEDQGVHVEAEDGTVLVSQAAARPVHPASVSKIPTTLALLRALGPDHRFETRFAATGPLEGGVLRGDLLVEASGDPFLVDENALLVLLALREAGVSRVAGTLVARGPLLFNWKRDGAAARLRAALEGRVAPRAWDAVRAREGGSARVPGIAFARAAGDGDAAPGAPRASTDPHAGPDPRTLLVHRSQPLVPLVKALNGYSNNIFAPLADAAGGLEAVQRLARESVPPALRAEIVLGDGAGAHPANRISPRAAVALLRALQEELARHGQGLEAVLPVAGVDEGTLRHRLDGPGELGHVAAKTGTYGSYGACALAGAVRTASGLVYFAILNRGVPVEPARRRQDAFVRALLAALPTTPFPYDRDTTPAFARAEVH